MKVGLISGHGAGDSGALGCGYQEADLTIDLVKRINKLLEAAGIDTIIYPFENNAFKDAKNGGLVADFSDCTYVLEVHFNACYGQNSKDGVVTGTGIWVTPREKGVTVEKKICDKVAQLGFKNRGVKKADFLVINCVKDQGVSSALIETCFIDDADDMEIYDGDRDAVAAAITAGIFEGFGITGSLQNVGLKEIISRVYAEELSREVDESGLDTYMFFLKNGGTEEQMRGLIRQSEEYRNKHLTIKAGDRFELTDATIYTSAYGSPVGNRTGTYYVWSAEVINNKIKMTNKPEYVGVVNQVDFFVDINELLR